MIHGWQNKYVQNLFVYKQKNMFTWINERI